jgi:hypothetical protein
LKQSPQTSEEIKADWEAERTDLIAKRRKEDADAKDYIAYTECTVSQVTKQF